MLLLEAKVVHSHCSSKKPFELSDVKKDEIVICSIAAIF